MTAGGGSQPPKISFAGFHEALENLYAGVPRTVTLAADGDSRRSFSPKVWRRMVKRIHEAKGFTPDMLADPDIRAAVDETYRVLSLGVDSAITRQVPQELTDHLKNDTFLFSGFKTYHEAREVSQLLLDEESGSFKSFDRFFEDVQSVHECYNERYLEAEYNFAVQSTQMAVKWKEFEADGDRYLLQYRTANDGLVRPEHQALHNTTLPIGDPFWDSYTPPLGWNCRCTVVQVGRGKYPESDSAEAIRAGEAATAKPKQRIFRFNPGKTGRVFPPKHPYFPKGCGDCRYRAQRRLAYKPDNPMCQACNVLAKCMGLTDDKKTAYREVMAWGRANIIGKYIYKHKDLPTSINFSKNSFSENLGYGSLFYAKTDILNNIKKTLSGVEHWEIDSDWHEEGCKYYYSRITYNGSVQSEIGRTVKLVCKIEKNGQGYFHFIKFE